MAIFKFESKSALPIKQSLIEKLYSFSTISLGIGLPILFLLGSYFRIDIPGSLLFNADDGWCITPFQSIGLHCFGDLNERVTPNNLDPDQRSSLGIPELSPLGPSITAVANFLSGIFGQKVMLLIFIVFYSSLVLMPIVNASQGLKVSTRFGLVTIFGFCTLPFLATIDRLNSVAFAVPLMYLFLTNFSAGKDWLTIWSIVGLVLVKPVFGLLCLAFLIRRKYLPFAYATVISPTVTLLLLWLSNLSNPSYVREWILGLVSYGGSSENADTFLNAVTHYPPNASLSRAIFLAGRLTGIFPNVRAYEYSESELGRSATLLIISLTFAFVCIIGLWVFASKLSDFEISSALLIISSLFLSGYVGSYYLVFVIAIIGYLIFNEANSGREAFAEQRKFLGLLLSSGILLTNTLLVIPYSPNLEKNLEFTDDFQKVGMLSLPLAVMTWFLYVVAIVGAGAMRNFRQK